MSKSWGKIKKRRTQGTPGPAGRFCNMERCPASSAKGSTHFGFIPPIHAALKRRPFVRMPRFLRLHVQQYTYSYRSVIAVSRGTQARAFGKHSNYVLRASYLAPAGVPPTDHAPHSEQIFIVFAGISASCSTATHTNDRCIRRS